MQILKHLASKKIALLALIVLVSLYGLALLAPFFAPYPYTQDDIEYAYAPPTKIHLINSLSKRWQLFICPQRYTRNQYFARIYQEDKQQVVPLEFFVRGFEYKLFGLKFNRHLFGTKSAKLFLLGADSKGRDIFSRIVYGARVSLSIGLIGAVISFSIGLLVGALSGYFGGRLDNFLMRFCEMLMMVPSFYLMLALRASFPINLTSTQIYLLIVVILSFIGWASLARIIRGMVMSIRENEFIYAAKSLGLSDLRIILRHILPHTFSYAIVAIVVSIPSYILGEAGLSLIGLGIQDPEASWGNLLSAALGIVEVKLHPWILFPGVFILITVMAFNIVGDALRDILDPKRRIL